MNKFRSFIVVGALGFVIDASGLQLLYIHVGLPVIVSRLFSFGAACSVTWYFNRRFTFRVNQCQNGKIIEYARYFSIQILGAVANLTVFFVLIGLFPPLADVPVAPLAAGACVGVMITFLGSQRFVFVRR